MSDGQPDGTGIAVLEEWKRTHEHTHQLEAMERRERAQGIDRRFENVNEFREALSDQSARMVTRELYDQGMESMQERFDRHDRRIGRQEAIVPIVALVSGGLSAAITAVILKAVGA